MKSFKEFLKDQPKEELPTIETFMGKHSEKKSELPTMETSMGKHSVEPKKKVNESWDDDDDTYSHHDEDSPPDFPHHSKEDQDHIHHHVTAEKDKSITKHEKLAIHEYTKHSTGLADALHKNHKRKTPMDAGNHAHAAALTKVLSKQSTKEDTHVYTGLKHSPSEHFKDKDQKHAEVHLPAFTSTTTNPRTAHAFADDVKHNNDKHHGVQHNEYGATHILKIHVPKGTQAMSVRKHSNEPTEHEVLLNRGHNIKISRNPRHIGGGVHIWDAHISGHEPSKLHKED